MKKQININEPKHLRFAVLASDTVLLTFFEKKLFVRLAPVNRAPYFINKSGLPGGLLDPKETAEKAAVRHLKSKGDISSPSVYIEQLYTFSDIKRDPRGRVVAVAYLALVPWESLSQKEKENTKDAFWCPIEELPSLAYDHDEITSLALNRLRSRITYTTLISKLLPKEFTLIDLEEAYRIILKKRIDRRNFRKKILKLKLLTPLNKELRGMKWRPAKLYTFRSSRVLPINIL